MSLQLTAFGVLFLPLALIYSLRRDSVLLVFVPVAAVMQSMSIATVVVGDARFGLAATYVVFTAISVRMLANVVREKLLYVGAGSIRTILLLWVAFSLVSAVGALVLPRVFAGLPVHLMLTNVDPTQPLEPLRWSLSNFAQAINSVGHCMVLLFAVNCSRFDQDRALRHLVIGFSIALSWTFGIGAYHRLMLNGHVPDATTLLASNVSYIQSFNSASWAPYIRASLPFIEPSYASAWFAAAFAGGLVGARISGHRFRWSCVALTGLAGLANSAGFSGIAAASIFVLIFVAACLFIQLRKLCIEGFQLRSVLGLLVVMLGFGMATYSLQSAQPEIKWIESKVDIKLAELAVQGDTLGHRGKSNLDAISIAKSTYGFGAGAGSNRSSSYLLSLLSNTGVLGVILFLLALGLQCFLVARNCFSLIGEVRGLTGPYLGAFACLMIAVTGGIPDQNWPVLWAFITLGLVLSLPDGANDVVRESRLDVSSAGR